MSSLQCPTTMILARHGEAEYEARVWAEEGGSLTMRGRSQAAALAEAIRGRRVAHVWTSTLARAVQTGEIVAAALGVSVTTRRGLREFDIGELVGDPLDTDPFAATYGAWIGGELDVRIPGGETGAEVLARVRETLCEIADQHCGDTVLVISHGGALRLAIPLLARMSVDPIRLGNCASVELAIDADDWSCSTWG